MEIADVKRRVVETIERAKRQSADRRARADAATQAYDAFLNQIAVPIVRQIANVLRAHGYTFEVFTPAGGVRLASERGGGDYIELELDTSSDRPSIIGRFKRSRGRQVVESEQSMGDPSALSEEDVLTFFLKSLEGLVER
jgi:hypothetical protein